MYTQDEKYMKEAIKQARKAYALGEVPYFSAFEFKAAGYERMDLQKRYDFRK